MTVRLLAFAQTAQITGFREFTLECAGTETPRQIWARVAPALDPASTRVAVNQEYAGWDEPIGESASEIALIPPVSGG